MTTGQWFGALPIRHKLVALIMLTATTVLALAGSGFLLTDYFRTREQVRVDLETKARLVMENSVVAIDFEDRQAAMETLRTLQPSPQLRVGCIYKPDGELLVEFRPLPQTEPCAPRAPRDGYHFSLNRLEIALSQRQGDKLVGSVYLRSALDMIWDRLRIQALVVLVLLLAAVAVAFLVSARLQGLVSEPVMALAGTATDVSAKGDYSLRATRTTDDELGVLVDAFNRMLDRIQEREEELSKANVDLRREIAERRRAEQERAELLVREREANRLKDEFLATLSHELRTPLNAILGWTKLLRANAVPEPARDRALEKVERNAQIQSRLVEDLLEISRIASGKLHLELSEVDLVAIVKRAVDSIRPAAEARGVTIERRSGETSLVTVGDADRLQQVIWNLLTNAVKFTPAGGLVRIELTSHVLFDEVKVTDTGIGIEPEFLPHVFDTFRQADASSTRAHGGLGLGLSIVRHLVEMHGGAVEAQSGGADRGATFIVRLPVRTFEAPPESSAPAAAVEQGSLAGTTVLVVDDDQDTRDLLASVFETAGARVHAAGSAVEALTTGVDVQPDAIVSDIAMPGQDGYSLIQQLFAALGPRAPRVAIALTAFAGQSDRERSAAAGFHRHIAKPVDPLALVKVIEELLGANARST